MKIDCDEPHPDEPLQQGDILLCYEPPHTWEHLRLVVTADCDIAQGKTSGFLTCVPVVAAKVYLEDVWAPKRVATFERRLIIQARDELHRHLARSDALQEPMSDLGVRRWVDQANPTKVLDDLKGVSESDMNKLTLLHAALRSCASATLGTGEVSPLSLLPALHCFPKAVTQRAVDVMRAEASAILTSLPLDSYFISSIPNLPVQAVNDLGHVALLRYVREVPQAAIATKKSAMTGAEPVSIRVARLLHPFKFALIQKFSQLFSRVGLPDEFEDEQRLIADAVASSAFEAQTERN